MSNKTEILRVLVGSRAHGLHKEDSDFDYRGVYVLPTQEILSLGYKYKGTSWIEGEQDNTSYEIGHFLQLCTKANPSVLEVLLSDQIHITSGFADEMRQLLPYMYDPKDAFNAFAGYSSNQRKKLLDNHLGRRSKFAVAYVRTAYCLYDLLLTGRFKLEVDDPRRKEILTKLKYSDDWSDGYVIDLAEEVIGRAKEILPKVKSVKDIDKINGFLMKVRKHYWE